MEIALDELKTHRKRDSHRHWPQPTKPPDQAVVIVACTARGP